MSQGSDSAPRECPHPAELAAFIGGRLVPPQRDEVAAHVACCPQCEGAARRMDDPTEVTTGGRVPRGPVRCAAPSESQWPTQLGQYKLFERLGQGGMGTVYRAQHVRLKKWVAVKVLEFAHTRDPRAVARFHREIEAVGRFDHPNIVRATDAGEADGAHFLVMELVEGRTFADLVQARGPLPVPEACELARQAALALQSAHEHGLVHRDVKPSNLMLSSAGQVKLLDLGLARLRSSGADELTRAGEVLGTAEYMAPEQWAETHSVDIRADLYSLGCTLFALLVGEAPFPGSGAGSFLRLMCAHQQDPVPAIADRRADVPAALCALMTRLLAKDPGGRPATPGAVAAELDPLARGADLIALSVPGAKTVPNRVAAPPVRLRPRRKLRFAAVLLAVAATGLGALLVRATAPARADRADRAADPTSGETPDPKAWRNLLTARPGERLWRPNELSLLDHSSNKEQLTVQSTRPSFLRFGETAARGYKLQFGFRQVRWTGGFGVYFGGRPGSEPSEFVCQFLDLRHVRHGKGREYGVVRSRAQIFTLDNAGDFSPSGIATGYVAPPGLEEQLLELDVRPSGLAAVRWNGTALPELVGDQAATRAAALFPGDPHLAGEFGVYCHGATVTFFIARYIVTE